MLVRFVLVSVIVLFFQQVKCQYVAAPLQNDLKEMPRVEVIIHDSALMRSQLNLAFTTLDSKVATGQHITDPASFQIVSAYHPFPPKVFALAQVSQYQLGTSYLMQDFRNHGENTSSIYLNFNDSAGAALDAYLIMKKDSQGRYMVIDTFGSNDQHSVDAHSFVVDKNGNYWYLTYQYHTHDMSYRTHNPRDTGAAILTTQVGVWNPKLHKNVFTLDLWQKGLLQIDSIPMNVMEEDTQHLTFDVSHANSWMPAGDMDGCPVGVLSDLMDGIKFIRLCDSTVLRYGASQPDFKALDTASHKLYLQHDFKMIEEGPYKGYFTCFNDGSGPRYTFRHSSVPILKFDLKQKTVKMVYEYSFPDIYSVGRGNVDFSGDYILINFGVEKSKVEGFRKDSHFRDTVPSWIIKNVVTHQLVAAYYLPTVDHSYNVWFMKDKAITRPRVLKKSGHLALEGSSWTAPVWSSGETERTIVPGKNGKYYVSVNGGSIFRMVSDEILFSLPGVKTDK